MAQTLKIKRSTVTTAPTSLSNGELAYSTVSGKLFIGRPGGGTGDIDALGGVFYTNIVDAATNANTASTLVIRDGSGNFSASTITANLTGNVTGNVTGTAGTVTGAAQTSITSLGTLTALQVDNININGNTISTDGGTDLNIVPLAGQQLILDNTIVIDAGVVTGATSITSTDFFGDLTGDVAGNVSGTAATVTNAAQTTITSLGTLTNLDVDNININGNTISSTAGIDLLITPLTGQQLILDNTIVIDSGVVTGATSITSTAFVGNVTGNVTGSAGTINITTSSAASAFKIPFANTTASTTGVYGLLQETTGTFTYNPSSNTLTAVNFSGALLGNATTATALATSRTFSATGDVTTSAAQGFTGAANVSLPLVLATVNSNTGSFGSTTAIPVITVNGKGLITAVTTASISTSFDIAADSGTANAVNGGETLSILGTASEIETSVSGNSVTIGLPNDVTISGNLTVNGTTTTVNSTTLAVSDPLVALATGNNTTDVVDIGLYGLYDTSGALDLYGGLFRDADDGKWKLFKDNQAVPTTTVNTAGTGYAIATLVANVEGGTISGLTTDIAVADGGTGRGSFTSNGIVYGAGTADLAVTVAGAWDATNSVGQLLSVNASGVPTWTNTIDGGTF